VFNVDSRSVLTLKLKVVSVATLLCMTWVSPVASLEDPTRPPTVDVKRTTVMSTVSKRTRWTLSSTLVSSGRRTAVINDQVVSKGDRINGATVVSIQPSTVRLRNRGREVTLIMLKKKIKSLSRVMKPGQRK